MHETRMTDPHALNIAGTADRNAAAGASLLFANARQLLSSGESLAAARHYGPATALLVLGAEEALKGWLFAGYAVGLIGSADLPEFRKNHRLRHNIIGQIVELPSAAMTHLNVNRAWISEEASTLQVEDTSSDELLRDLAGRWLGKFFREQQVAPNDWWSQAQALKERGLYVDCSDAGWSSPATVDVQMYDETLSKARWIIEDLSEKGTNLLNSPEISQQLKDFLARVVASATD